MSNLAIPIDPAVQSRISQVDAELAVHEIAQAEQHLYSFARQAWAILNPGTPFMRNWHIRLICEYLMLVTRGLCTRLILNMPPRYMKSFLVSVMWPAWEWTQDPSTRSLFISYSGALSKLHSNYRRKLISSDWYRERWGHKVVLAPDHNRLADFMNSYGGIMYSTSIEGTATGMGGNRIIIDDPTNPKEAISDAKREFANSWFHDTAISRLDDKINGAIVLMQQRLHPFDMTGYLTDLSAPELDGYVLEKNGWTLLRIPLIAESDAEIVFPITKKVYQIREGDLLWPEREGPDQIQEYKRDPVVFSSQFQQRPTTGRGTVFQEEWFNGQYYDRIPVNPDAWILSLDTTYKDSAGSDFVCLGVWAWKGPNMYLDHLVRERLSFTACLNVIREVLAAYPNISSKLIEESANGAGIIDVLHTEIGGLIPIRPSGSKLSRAQAVTPFFQSKNVFIKMAHWTHDYVREMILFDGSTSTKHKKDDQVDMTTMAVEYMQRTFGGLQEYSDKNNIAIARFISTGRSRRRY